MSIKLLLFLSVLVIFVPSIFSQPPAPSSSSKQNSSTQKVAPWTSVKTLPAVKSFVSFDGRFSIGLPETIQGFAGLTPKIIGFNASGNKYTWKFQEAIVEISFLDIEDENHLSNEQKLRKFVEAAKINNIPDKKILEAVFFTQDKYPANKIIFTLPNGQEGTLRNYVDGKRQYIIQAIYLAQDSETGKLLNGMLDNFNIISKADVELAIQKKLAEVTPQPLPQEPVPANQKSDAEQDDLKGNIKKIVAESENISDESDRRGRKLSGISEFNKFGNLVKTLRIDYQGNPDDVVVYGYIDSKRVSKAGYINYSYNPPAPLSKPSTDSEPKRDLRYSLSYETKYKSGKLAEENLYSNNGKILTHSTYSYDNNKIEHLVYTSDGKLNQKYVYTVDKDGRIIEEIRYDVLPQKPYGDKKFSYTYEYDKQDNWIKKYTSKEVTENGKTFLKPFYIAYRTITYYE